MANTLRLLQRCPAKHMPSIVLAYRRRGVCAVRRNFNVRCSAEFHSNHHEQHGVFWLDDTTAVFVLDWVRVCDCRRTVVVDFEVRGWFVSENSVNKPQLYHAEWYVRSTYICTYGLFRETNPFSST